jgi:D-amino peptidase
MNRITCLIIVGACGLVLNLLGPRWAGAEPYELTESDVQDLSKVSTQEVMLFGVKLGDSEAKVKEAFVTRKIPGIKVDIQDAFVLLYDKKSLSNPMAGVRVTNGKVDYIFINQRFATLAAGVFRSVLRGDGLEETRKLLGKEDFADDESTFTRLNYKGGTMVIVFSGRDIMVEFNSAV